MPWLCSLCPRMAVGVEMFAAFVMLTVPLPLSPTNNPFDSVQLVFGSCRFAMPVASASFPRSRCSDEIVEPWVSLICPVFLVAECYAVVV